MIRATVTTWISEREDAIFFWTMAGLTAAIVALGIGVVVGIFLAITHPDPPHLFCASGTQLHSSPSTEMVGKTAVDGVRYTCS